MHVQTCTQHVHVIWMKYGPIPCISHEHSYRHVNGHMYACHVHVLHAYDIHLISHREWLFTTKFKHKQSHENGNDILNETWSSIDMGLAMLHCGLL